MAAPLNLLCASPPCPVIPSATPTPKLPQFRGPVPSSPSPSTTELTLHQGSLPFVYPGKYHYVFRLPWMLPQ